MEWRHRETAKILSLPPRIKRTSGWRGALFVNHNVHTVTHRALTAMPATVAKGRAASTEAAGAIAAPLTAGALTAVGAPAAESAPKYAAAN